MESFDMIVQQNPEHINQQLYDHIKEILESNQKLLMLNQISLMQIQEQLMQIYIDKINNDSA